jgi:FkbM family methyltransferase
VSDNGEQRKQRHSADRLTRDVRRREPIVSYAQNFEDVMLWRALADYGPGFYVDVGAGEPQSDSVTQLFYARGWRGINIEPMTEPYGRLRNARDRDINLNVALEEAPGRKTYFSVDSGNGLSTASQELAAHYRDDGRHVAEVEVEVTTLAEVCKTFVAQDIHFLKLDVEGGEAKVLAGADFERYRPWIVVSEAPEPNEPEKIPDWEAVLVAAGYGYIYFDGINRYYIANEKFDRLSQHFASPPNWIDNFVTASEAEASKRALDISARSEELGATLDAEIGHRQRVESELDAVRERSAEWERLVGEERAVRVAQSAELDRCYQELYEDSRQIGFLARERQNLYGEVVEIRAAAALTEQELLAQRAAADALELHIEALNTEIAGHRERIAEILASRSWRMSGPLRHASDVARGRVRRAGRG